jgi:uncharacterized cofD-like protein
MQKKKGKKVVVIGGGTGTFTVLTGLKRYPLNLTAVVAMSDDGGSTGILRDELGVLPPGDVRQCLVALSSSDQLMRTLMNYRFADGGLKGHSFGNLLLSALEKITGSFDSAVEKTGDILRIEGRVVPATLEKVTLVAKVGQKTVRGQVAVHETTFNGNLKSITLEPNAAANPKALQALKDADFIIIGPGDFYSSLVPNLLVEGLPEALRKSKAKKIYMCNLVSRKEHNPNYSVAEFTRKIEEYIGGPVDIVVYNNKLPNPDLIKKYARDGEVITRWDDLPEQRELIGADLITRVFPQLQKGDILQRNFIRHDPARLASILVRRIQRRNSLTHH